MSSVRCILLDLGKVLIDFEIVRFAARMNSIAGAGPEQLRAAVMGDGLALRYESGRIPTEEFHAEVCRRLGRLIDLRDFADAWNSIFSPDPILPDEILLKLASKTDLWILSNTNPLHFEFVTRHYPLLRHFKGCVVSYEVGVVKPDPIIFRQALQKAGFVAAETLFVDDLLPNVQAAQDLGIDAFQFLDQELFIDEMTGRKLL